MNCTLCGAVAVPRFRLGSYGILRCGRCGFGWPWPMPSPSQLTAFYSRQCRLHLAQDSPNRHERLRTARMLRRLLPRGRTVLDVGCGFGHSLDAARRFGFRTYGIEPNAARAAWAAARGHRIAPGPVSREVFPGVSFDAVILNHVIEHLADPLSMLRSIHDVLVPGGILFIGCPNFAGLSARIQGPRYHHYCPPEHIAYFTTDSLRRCAARAGFHPVLLRCFTHTLHVKDLLAHLLRLRFLLPAQPRDVENSGGAPCRFVDGPGRIVRAPVYRLILGASWLLRPLVNAAGGDHIESYWRKVAA